MECVRPLLPKRTGTMSFSRFCMSKYGFHFFCVFSSGMDWKVFLPCSVLYFCTLGLLGEWFGKVQMCCSWCWADNGWCFVPEPLQLTDVGSCEVAGVSRSIFVCTDSLPGHGKHTHVACYRTQVGVLLHQPRVFGRPIHPTSGWSWCHKQNIWSPLKNHEGTCVGFI